MTTDRTPRTLDVNDLKALAHPLRVQLLDALSTYGAATASGLADRLGESSGATSYHLRQLEKHGFVREVEGKGSARERWWERVPGGIMLDATRFERESPERAATDLLLGEWERNRRRLLSDFLSRGDSLGHDWLDASTLNTTNLRLTAAQTADLNDALATVITEYADRYRNQDVPGSRPVQLQLNLFPVVDGAPSPELTESDNLRAPKEPRS
ncbi:transcriptional regulator [uncultured Schumannella sp.]|uniref:ArsR/SmtB family transcription factor n=1 Tax=uncultured Schumannella sp. TaxID=1195956 RepID=UPI0025FA701E|nr:helix-turn-helix domain-containing protein [uncultured Schumannella sp.]